MNVKQNMKIYQQFDTGMIFKKDFWSYVKKTKKCWLWTGKTSGQGYGRVRVPASGYVLAHRFSWQLHNGNNPIPDGLLVLHKCDNPPCVNPKHLFLGTHADNMRDMIAKNRQDPNLTRVKVRAAKMRAMTHCKHGHSLADAYIINRGNRYERNCRICQRLRALRRYQQR